MNFRQQLQEAYEAGYRSALNEQDVYKRPVKVSALGGQKFHAIVDSKGVIVAAGLTEKEARKKKKFGQKVMELPGAKVGQVIKKETVNEQITTGADWPGLLNYMMTYGFGNTSPAARELMDYNDDGVIDFQDLLKLLQLWGNGSPAMTAREYIDGIYSLNEPEPFDVKKISKTISKAVKSKRSPSRLSRGK